MCQFSYLKYDCSHWTVECGGACSKSLWLAGRFGKLQLCSPITFDSGSLSGSAPTPIHFEGLMGFCPVCCDEFKIPAQPREKREGFDQLILYDPGTYDAEDNAPYLVISALSATIPQLLDIAVQYDPFQEGTHMGENVHFPRQLLKMKWIEFWNPENYQVQGYLDGVTEPMSWDDALKNLDCEDGFTWADKMIVTDAIITQHDLDAVYQDMFMPRGMLYSSFFALEKAAEEEATRLQELHIQDELKRRQLNAPLGFDLTSLGTIPDITDNEGVGQDARLPSQPGNELASTWLSQVQNTDDGNPGLDAERAVEHALMEAWVKEYEEHCRLLLQHDSPTQANTLNAKNKAVDTQTQGTLPVENASVPKEDGKTSISDGVNPSTAKQIVTGFRLSPVQTHHTITRTRALSRPKGPYTKGKPPAHIRRPNPSKYLTGSPPPRRRRSSRTLRSERGLETQGAASVGRNSDDDDDGVVDDYFYRDHHKPVGRYFRRRLGRPVYKGPPSTRRMAVANPFLDGDEDDDEQLAADAAAQYLAGSQPQQQAGTSHVAGPAHDHNNEQAEAAAMVGRQSAKQEASHNTNPVVEEMSGEEYALMVQQLQHEYESFRNELLSAMSPAKAQAKAQFPKFDAEQSLAVMGIVPARDLSTVAGRQASGGDNGQAGNPSTPVAQFQPNEG